MSDIPSPQPKRMTMDPEPLPIEARPSPEGDQFRKELDLPPTLWSQREFGLSPIPAITPAEQMTRAIAASDDPLAEISKLKASEFLAGQLKIPVGAAFANFDKISEYWMGKAMPPDTFMEGIGKHWRNGQRTFDINEVGNKLSMTTDPTARGQLLEQVAEMRKGLEPIKDVPKIFLLKWLDWVVDSAPQMLNSMIAGGMTAFATQAVAGAMIGALPPLALASGGWSPVALAAAMGTVGLVSGTTLSIQQNMRGAEYLRMIEAGVPHDVASPISLVSSFVQGGLESAGELLVGLPFIPFKSIGERVAGKVLMTGFGAKMAMDIGIKLAAAPLGEGVENSLQYLTQAVSDQVAMELSKGRTTDEAGLILDKPSIDALVKEFGRQFYQGFGAGVIFGVIGIPRGIRADVKQMGSIKRLALIMPDKASFIKAVQDAKVATGEGVNSQAWSDYLGKVYDKQQEVVRQTLKKRNEAEAVAGAEAGAKAPAAAPVVPPNVQMRISSEGTGPAGPRSILIAGESEGGKRFGFVRYTTQGNTITVNEVVNEPGQSLDKQMMVELMRRNPSMQIVWNPVEPSQVDIRDELIAGNPQGAQAGLNWFQGEAQAQAAVTVDTLKQAFKETYALTDEQAEFFAVFAERRARKRGQDVNQWLATRVRPGVVERTPQVQAAMEKRVNPETGEPEPAQAATLFRRPAGQIVGPLELNAQGLQQEVQASFAALQGADFHHAVHEFFHMIERLDLTPEEIGLFEFAIGKPRAMWTELMIEDLAQKFEDYLATGKAPTPELQSLFQRIAEMFRHLVSYLKGKDLLDPKFEAAYNELFTVPESGINQASPEEAPAAPVQVTEADVQQVNGFERDDSNTIIYDYEMYGVQAPTENGPAESDPVALPPALYHVRDIEGWEAQVSEYMANNGFTPEEIKTQLQAIHGQMKLFNALGEHEIEFFPIGAHEITHKFPKLGMSKKGSSTFKGFGPIRGNADPIYRVTFDASAMCPKRLAAAATQLWVQGKLNRALTASERLALVALFKLNGKTAPCIYCYVESPRGKAGEFVGRAQAIIRGEKKIPGNWSAASKVAATAAIAAYNKAPVEIDPNIWVDPAYTETPEAQAKIAEAPEIYGFIRSQYNAAKSNVPKLYEAYDGHILNTPAQLIDELNNYAGFRFFSSSDFQIEHVVDLMQAFNDLALKRAKSHSYSKVLEFIEIFGGTGQKINTSIFAREENGQIVEDNWQGMTWADAQRMREKFPDVGTILVATSDAIVEWGLDQPWVDYIIPFHYSGLEKKFYQTLDWADFTSKQKERWAKDPVTGKRPKKGHVPQIRMYELGTAEGVSNQELGQRYRALCAERGLEPVFSKWANHPEFGKLKKDYARTDTPFNVTKPIFDMAKVDEVLQKLFAGQAPKAVVDEIVGRQLLQKIDEFKMRPGEDIGVEALKAVQSGAMFSPEAIAGEEAVEEIKALFHADPKEISSFNSKAEKTFGVTVDPEYGRWILTNGKMLDFKDPTDNRTKMPHKMIEKVMGEPGAEEMSFGSVYREAWRMDAMRMDLVVSGAHKELTLQSVSPPNKTQLATIQKVLEGVTVLYIEKMAQPNERGGIEDSSWKEIKNPTLQNVEDFYAAADLYTSTGETALFHVIEENPAYEDLVASASKYETVEAFQADMEKTFGEGTPAAIEAYVRIWNTAHPEAVVPPVAPAAPRATGIPLPERREEAQYNFEDKLDAAREISDPALARAIETGEITDQEVDEAIAKNFGEEQALREQKIAPAELTPDEQAFVADAEQLDALPAKPKTPTAAALSKRLINRIATALKKDPSKVALMSAYIFVSTEDATLKKAIADARLENEKAQAALRIAKIKTDVKTAKAEIRAKEAAKRQELRAKMYTERREAMRKFREKVTSAIKARDALRKLKEARKKIIRAIMAPVSSAIEYRGYADRIQLIQRQIDPRTHRIATLEEREASRKFFDMNPDAAALVPAKTLEKIYSVPVQNLTLAELEQLHALIEGLKDLGRLKRSLIVGQHKRWKLKVSQEMANAVLRGEPLERVIGAAKGTPLALKAYLMGLKPGRVAQLLDGIFAGVTQHGPFWELLQDRPNQAWNAMSKMMDKRRDSVLSQLDKLKITLDPYGAKRLKGYTYIGQEMDIEGFTYTNGKKPTMQQVMFWYIGIKNEKSRAALIHGNNLDLDTMQKGIDLLPKNAKALADLIAADFDANFERYRQAFIDNFNEDLPREDFYVPMIRLERSYKTREEKAAAELTGRSGMTKHYVDRGSTHARIEISDDHQTPIGTNLLSIWMDAVQHQEGFIYQDAMIKDMHSILGSDTVRLAIQQKYGPAMNEWLRKYTNDLARDEAYESQAAMEKWSRMMRANAAIAWLGFNLLSASKQFIGWINALADAGPLHLASAAAQLAAAQGKSIATGKFNNSLVEWVMERSPLVKHRMISQELEDMKRINAPGYQLIVKKIGGLSLKALQTMDMISVVVGWKAVYDKSIAKGMGEAEAIKEADDATVRTQPSMRVQDMAEMYRGSEALKWFTMFTSDLNSTYNRLAFDVPAAVRNGQILHAFTDMLTFAIAGTWIALASGALHGDDEEKKRKKLILGVFSQYFEAVPFVGNDVWAALSGKTFQSGGVKIFPAISYVQSIPADIAKEEWGRAVTHLAEAAGFFVGLPVSGVRRTAKLVATGDVEALLGWPVKKEEK